MRLRASDLEKRYQVFISSTFQDLQGARQEVSQALLRADCFPAGMELFPAADEEQFEFIKTVIDQSDYYILISAGRYGSIHPETGLSYKEMEYDYAVETGKPVIRLLHADPFNDLKRESIEQTDLGREKLKLFQKKLASKRLVKFWSDEKELGSAVDHSLRHMIKTKPADGWVRPRKEQNTSAEQQSNSFDPVTLAREIGYQNLRSQMIPNRMRLGHHSINSASWYGSKASRFDCDLCKGSGFVTVMQSNSEREIPCLKCKDEGRI
jgi:hypothetical protein